jgi:hypothetical protein
MGVGHKPPPTAWGWLDLSPGWIAATPRPLRVDHGQPQWPGDGQTSLPQAVVVDRGHPQAVGVAATEAGRQHLGMGETTFIFFPARKIVGGGWTVAGNGVGG